MNDLPEADTPSDRILKRLYAEAEAKDYEPAETDWDKVPTREEMKAILAEKRNPPSSELGLEDFWPLELSGKVKRDRARKKSSSDESP